MRALFKCCIAAMLLSGAAWADPPKPATPTAAAAAAALADPEGDDPGCAEEGAARKGVQKKTFLKKYRLELSGWGGFFAGDLVSTTYSYGGAISFYFTEDLGVEVSLLVQKFDLAVEKPLSQFFMGQRFVPTTAFIGVLDLIWSPVHLKVRATEHAIVHGDLVFALGAGDTFNDQTVQGMTVDAGLGLKIYLSRFVTLRFDLRDYLMIQEAVSVQRTVNNIVGMAGLSLWPIP